MDDRLTPEERAVIKAAATWFEVDGPTRPMNAICQTVLMDAVAAYRKATAPPEPFDVVFIRERSGPVVRGIFGPNDTYSPTADQEVWRGTVTLTERVHP